MEWERKRDGEKREKEMTQTIAPTSRDRSLVIIIPVVFTTRYARYCRVYANLMTMSSRG